jgi:hypothetical protein
MPTSTATLLHCPMLIRVGYRLDTFTANSGGVPATFAPSPFHLPLPRVKNIAYRVVSQLKKSAR